ncbi:thrombospondin type 3 repeat-containing protein [bacterium]|nr:thrombospondin type 3 repeat-containing protein [bacterium]MBU1958185.1 thrombospondin type 3 repeat-containing protein [bacterium]
MKYTSITLTLLLFSSISVADQDYDIDGVEDSLDACPNTPFDVLVDAQGCPSSGEISSNTANKYLGQFTFKVGTDIRTDETYENTNALNLYANYRYRQWDVSVSNSRTTTNNSYTEDNSDSDNDIYLATGYTFMLPQSAIKLSVGTKLVNDDTQNVTTTTRGRNFVNVNPITQTIASRDNDYFASLNFNYLLNSKQDMFLYYGYTLSGDSTDTEYEDYSSFSLGTGYALTNAWYSALSYNYTGSIYPTGEAEQGLSWFNSYSFNKNLFATAAYTYALEDFSYDNTFSLALGVRF